MCDVKCLELDDLKGRLNDEGIKFEEVRTENGGIFVYVDARMQMTKCEREALERQFFPEVRVSCHEGDCGYYVKSCGAIIENMELDEVIDEIKGWI